MLDKTVGLASANVVSTTMHKRFSTLPLLLSAVLAVAAALPLRAEDTSALEIAFAKLTDEILADQFAFQPLNAVSLGVHQYDGKFVDFSRRSVDAEIARTHGLLKRLETGIDPAKLSAPSALDYKLLKLGTENFLFQLEEAGTIDRNPMTYALTFDANVYLKRDYAPLADRLRSLIATERQVPAMFAAAHANLAEVLPKSEVDLAVVIARGNADFLRHDLVDAVKDVQDPGSCGVQDRQRPRRRRDDRLRRLAGKGTAAQG